MKQSSYLFILIFSFFSTLSFGANVDLSFEIKNPSAEYIQIEINKNVLTNDLRIFRATIREGGKANLQLDLVENQIIKIIYQDTPFDLFLEPGDDLKVNFDGTNVTGTLNFEGKGDGNNRFLRDFQRFYSSNKQVKYEKGNLPVFIGEIVNQKAKSYDTNTYFRLLNQDRDKQMEMLLAPHYKAHLSADFFNYMNRHISYNFETNKLAYFLANQDRLKPAQIQSDWITYQLLSSVDMNEDKAVDHPTFHNLLNAFVQYLYLENPYDLDDYGPAFYGFINKNIQGKPKYFQLARLMINQYRIGQSPDLAQRKFPSFEQGNPYKVYTENIKSIFGHDLIFTPNESAPDFFGVNTKGAAVSLYNYRGKVVYMSFWASWCHPCLKGFQKTEHIRKELEAKGVILLNINMDDNQQAWRQTMARVNMPGINVFVDDLPKVKRLYNITSLPLYHILDKNGNYTYLSDEDNRDIIAEFEKLLNQ